MVAVNCGFVRLRLCGPGGGSQPVLAPVYRLRRTELGAIGLYKLVSHDDDSAQARRARLPPGPEQIASQVILFPEPVHGRLRGRAFCLRYVRNVTVTLRARTNVTLS